MSSRKPTQLNVVTYESGYGIGISFLVALAAPFVYVTILRSSFQAHPFAGAIFFVVFSAIFLLGYFRSHKSFLFRWVEWLCERGSFPASKKMAFFYFALSCGGAIGYLLQALGFVRPGAA